MNYNFRNGSNRKGQPLLVFYLLFVTLIVPTCISLILVNRNLVLYLIIPLHLAGTAHYVKGQHTLNIYIILRNFIIFVIVMPIVYAPFGMLGNLFKTDDSIHNNL